MLSKTRILDKEYSIFSPILAYFSPKFPAICSIWQLNFSEKALKICQNLEYFLSRIHVKICIIFSLLLLCCNADAANSNKNHAMKNSNNSTKIISTKYEKAILAGGCFWGMQELFRQLDGVVYSRVGYTGGKVPNPTYEVVSTGLSNHAESVEVVFDPSKISYEKLLKFFFTIHDPRTVDRQQNDVGSQYRSEIFYFNEEQKKIAQDVIKQANEKVFHGAVVTKLEKAGEFYEAEKYHQDYLKNNPNGYTCHYLREEWKF